LGEGSVEKEKIKKVLETSLAIGLGDKATALLTSGVINLLVDLLITPPADPILAPPIVFAITWALLRNKFKHAAVIAAIAAVLSAFYIP